MEVVNNKIPTHEEMLGKLIALCSRKKDPELDIFILLLIRRGIVHMESEDRWLPEVLRTLEIRTTETRMLDHEKNGRDHERIHDRGKEHPQDIRHWKGQGPCCQRRRSCG